MLIASYEFTWSALFVYMGEFILSGTARASVCQSGHVAAISFANACTPAGL